MMIENFNPLTFSESLFSKVITGEKSVTRRPVKQKTPTYNIGETVRGRYSHCQSTPRIALRIVSIRKVYLFPLSQKELKLEGFANYDEFRQFWNKCYKNTEWELVCGSNPKVWRIEFEVVKP